MELKNISLASDNNHREMDVVDTEKFIFDNEANNDEKILLGLFFIALSLR